MALLLNEIAWSEPLFPAAPDPAWEAELKRRGARSFEVDKRIAASPWLREAAYATTSYLPRAMPERLFRIGAVVTAQENACRYCYGANRAYMKVLGYSEAFIQRIERDVHLAELDEKDRVVITFCRNLSRSRPRPSKAAVDTLLVLGFTRPQVIEMAFVVALGCFFNRLSTLIACPPEQQFERLANGPVGRLMGLAAPLMRLLPQKKAATLAMPDAATLAAGRFGPVVAPLAGLPAAEVMRNALEGAFDSAVLSRPTKALMFAIVARTLTCPHCEREATQLLASEGFGSDDIASALATLQSPRLPAAEQPLLAWTRETVSYETASIQQKTRALGAGMAPAALLEAIGVASLANATVRLAMLLE